MKRIPATAPGTIANDFDAIEDIGPGQIADFVDAPADSSFLSC